MKTRLILSLTFIACLICGVDAYAQQEVICVAGCSAGNTGTDTMANSTPVTIATDDTVFAALQTSVDAAVAELVTLNGSLADLSVHGQNVLAGGPGIQGEAKDFDGSALPNVVTEGQSIRVATTLSGGVFSFLTNEAGTKELGKLEDDAHASADYGMPIWGVRQNSQSDLAADGDYIPFTITDDGGLRTEDVNSDAIAASLAIIDNAETAASHYAYTSAGSTEDEHVVVAAPATLWSITATNTAATAAYIRCENQDQLADGAPGTDTLDAATDLDLSIPGDTTGAGITFNFPRGAAFSIGIKCWLTTEEAYSSVAEVGANDVKLFYSYK